MKVWLECAEILKADCSLWSTSWREDPQLDEIRIICVTMSMSSIHINKMIYVKRKWERAKHRSLRHSSVSQFEPSTFLLSFDSSPTWEIITKPPDRWSLKPLGIFCCIFFYRWLFATDSRLERVFISENLSQQDKLKHKKCELFWPRWSDKIMIVFLG